MDNRNIQPSPRDVNENIRRPINQIREDIRKRENFKELFGEFFPQHYRVQGNCVCPFHEDNRASFQADELFGFCHARPNAECSPSADTHRWDCVALVRKVKELSFVDAILWLAERYGTPIVAGQGETRLDKARADLTRPDATRQVKAKSKILTFYSYVDEDGNLLYEVGRTDPKGDFPARRPDPDHPGKWIWKLDTRDKSGNIIYETRRVLFRLPKVLQAETVWFVEGEKDVENLEILSFSFTVTTNPGGAGKWSTLVNRFNIHEPLRGKHVRIIPDNDEPGTNHANQIAASLHGFAESVKIVQLPGLAPKQDISDFIEMHGDAAKSQLLALADSTPEWEPSPQAQSKIDQTRTPKQERPSKFRVLVNLLSQQDITFFRDQFQHPWACLRVNDHFENIRIRSGAFRNHLTRLYYLDAGGGVGRETLQQVQDLCCAQALHDGAQRPLSYRSAWQDGRILIDLGRSDWAAMQVSRDGWNIVHPDKPPFKRFSHMQALPEPASGGDIAAIFQVLPVRDDASRILLQCWLPTAFVPDIPCAAILLQGLQGSGKTFVSEILRMLVDPSATRSLSLPRDATELVQALDHHYLPVFDNLTSLPAWASDVLCRATTGLGHTKRELYTNDDDYTYFVQRSFILNGISLSTRPDLADRVLSIELERIPDADRKSKRELMERFETIRGGVFAAMLSALVRAMQIREQELRIENLPRLADWAEWAIPVAQAVGVGAERFSAALQDNATRQHRDICQTDPTAIALTAFMADREPWTGTSSALFAELVKIAADEKLDRESTWPKSPSAVSRRLRVLTHNLMATGIDVQHQRIGSGRTRTWIISRGESAPEISSAPSVSSNCNDSNEMNADDTRTAVSGGGNAVRNADRAKSAPGAIMDDTDSVDDISGLSAGRRDPRLIALGCYDCADLHNGGNHPVCIYGDGVVDLRNSGSVICPKQL